MPILANSRSIILKMKDYKEQYPEAVHPEIMAILKDCEGQKPHQISEENACRLGFIYYQYWHGFGGEFLERQAERCRTCGARRSDILAHFRKTFPMPAEPAEPAETLTPDPENEETNEEQKKAPKKPRGKGSNTLSGPTWSASLREMPTLPLRLTPIFYRRPLRRPSLAG